MQIRCPYFHSVTFPDALRIAIWNTPAAGFEFAHNQSFDPVEWRCAAKIFTRTRRKIHIKTY